LIVAGFFLLPRISAHKIDKSIAVLPFQNLSDEKENTYFADGIQDDILTNLSKIGDLKVISRMSVMSYRGDGVRNAREMVKRWAWPLFWKAASAEWLIVSGSVCS
jgi:Predicted integral membrane protein